MSLCIESKHKVNSDYNFDCSRSNTYCCFGTLFLVWEAVAVIFGVIVASWYFGEVFTVYRFFALLLALAALFFAYK